jgi:hypothetical protein
LLTKSERYYYDAEAIKQDAKSSSEGIRFGGSKYGDNSDPKFATKSGNVSKEYATANRRSVWTITTKPYSGAHFATMPPDLVEPCIKAGTSEHGCCPLCGSPWGRLTSRTKLTRERPNAYTKRQGEDGTGNSCANNVAGVDVKTIGWQQTCDCDCPSPAVVPCTVIDPFAGSGTTLAVAAELGRSGIGCELNPEYVALAEERISKAKAKLPLFVS